MLSKLRAVVATTDTEKLSGRIEVDETLIGGRRPGRTGRGADGKTLVAGAIEVTESGWGRARMAIIPDASANSLRNFITANIALGSTIVSDKWRSYIQATDGYKHEPINISGSGKPAHESLPAIHRIFALVKRLLDGTYQGGGSSEHLQGYLDEYIFRFNRRKAANRGLLFMRLLQKCVESTPLTYQEITGINRPKPESATIPKTRHRRPGTLQTEQQLHPWKHKRMDT